MLHEITIKPHAPYDGLAHTSGTEILVDGKPFRGITSIYTDHTAGEIPKVTMTILPSRCEVETCAELNLQIDIDTVKTAIQCLQFALQLEDELKGGVIKSVESVLREESVIGINHAELAEKITDRVFGLET